MSKDNQEKCNCAEMTCPPECIKNHTHKGYTCGKCNFKPELRHPPFPESLKNTTDDFMSSPSHHEASPITERNYFESAVPDEKPEPKLEWNEASPKVEELFDNLPEEKMPGYGAHFFPSKKTIIAFITSLLLQKEEEHKREVEIARKEAYAEGWTDSINDRHDFYEEYEADIKEGSVFTERKRITDILDGMKKDGSQNVSANSMVGAYNQGLEQAKHLINNTEEK